MICADTFNWAVATELITLRDAFLIEMLPLLYIRVRSCISNTASLRVRCWLFRNVVGDRDNRNLAARTTMRLH